MGYEASVGFFFGAEQTVSGQMVLGRVGASFDVEGHPFLEGTGTTILEYQWNLTTGTGTGHGTIEFTSENYAESGWVGTFDIHYSDIDFFFVPGVGWLGVWNSFNKPVLHGYGVFDGMTLRALDTVTKGAGVHIAEGEILVPPSATLP